MPLNVGLYVSTGVMIEGYEVQLPLQYTFLVGRVR